jgi:hypothetical protein
MISQSIQIFNSDLDVHEAFIVHILKVLLLADDDNISNNSKLEQLHMLVKPCSVGSDLLLRGTDQSTEFHRKVYSSFDCLDFKSSYFYNKYLSMCMKTISYLKSCYPATADQLWAFQRYPTIRIHFPDNISVFEFHKDSDYSHPLGEVNCFYALTQCTNSSALQVEENLGFSNYKPLNLEPGQYALLNTSIFKHGDLLNKTGFTRVSMDFRFIPQSILGASDSYSLSTKKTFDVDDYFLAETEAVSMLAKSA